MNELDIFTKQLQDQKLVEIGKHQKWIVTILYQLLFSLVYIYVQFYLMFKNK